MTTLAYATLTPSSGSAKRLRILQGSLKPTFTKTANNKRTASGRSDTTEGAVIRGWTMVVKVRGAATGADPDGASYAVKADLETYYSYNNPYGTPSNRFTFTDNLGTAFNVRFDGALDEDNITPYLDGNNSWYNIPLMLEKVD